MALQTEDSRLEKKKTKRNLSPTNFLRNRFVDLLKSGVTEDAREKANVPPKDLGVTADVKLLYEGRSSFCTCCKVWDDEKPVDHDDAELRELAEKERDRWAILKKQTRHGRGTWKTHSVDINSPHIRERLKQVFADYPDVDPHAVKLSFSPPFLPFIHRWEQFRQVHEHEPNETARKHLSLLKDLLGPETEESFNTLQNIQDTGFVAFADLKLLYISGEIVIQSSQNVVSAGILRDVQCIKESGMSYYLFTVDVVDWNGEMFGVMKENWMILEYKGSRSLTELAVIPLRVHAESEKVKEKLVARGRKFEQLCGQHFRSYSGKATVMQESSDPYRPPITSYVPISERIIVDASTYYSLQDSIPRELRALDELAQRAAPVQYNGHTYPDDEAAGRYPPLPPLSISKTSKLLSNEEFSAAVSSFREPATQDNPIQPLSVEECFLTVAWVKGFAIHSKLWCKFEVSQIQDVEWNSTALQNLVLGEAEKRLLTAMIASQRMQQDAAPFDDFIDGKGKGIIILLSGPPGVGKTLTAESVAEHLQQPLYRLGASDLGSNIDTVESRLSEALFRCAAWNAVLLIDEADVFLQARTTDSLERNELISIFLRLLEYYTGILLLTTNRSSVLDPAFESRIDIALSYTPLDLRSRAQILNNFLSSLPRDSVEISQAEVEDLVAKPWNGRQIKSAVKTARILAASEGVKLGAAHLRVVLELRERATQKMEKG